MAEKYSSMTQFPKVALVGCGYWGKNLCRNFHALGALSLVVDSTESGQNAAKKLAPDVPVRSSFEDLLEDDSIQGVALATPVIT